MQIKMDSGHSGLQVPGFEISYERIVLAKVVTLFTAGISTV